MLMIGEKPHPTGWPKPFFLPAPGKADSWIYFWGCPWVLYLHLIVQHGMPAWMALTAPVGRVLFHLQRLVGGNQQKRKEKGKKNTYFLEPKGNIRGIQK